MARSSSALRSRSFGAPRSDTNTNGESMLSRLCRRNSRSSRPVSGWLAGVPALTLRTCRVAVAKSTCSQRRSTTSAARRPCLNARRAIRPSRLPWRFCLAASISFSTSAVVRCSRVRRSAFLGRRGVTVRFTAVGAISRRFDFAMIQALRSSRLFKEQTFYEQSQADWRSKKTVTPLCLPDCPSLAEAVTAAHVQHYPGHRRSCDCPQGDVLRHAAMFPPSA